MFHIGVLAPTLTGAAELLRHLRSATAERPGEQHGPELTLSWAPLGSGPEPWRRSDSETARSQLVLSSARLRQAGAHFFVCADDSAYVPLDVPGQDLALPGLHVASVVAAEAQSQGLARIGILGTRWTLGWARYDAAFEPLGISAVALPLRDRTTLHSIVSDELAHDRYWLRSRDHVLQMIHGLHLRGCQAVVLSCPELVSLVGPAISPVPLLDPTALLAASALAVARGAAAFPDWQGGPVGSLLRPDDVLPHQSMR